MAYEWVLPVVIGAASLLGDSKKPQKAKTPETEKAASLIGMSRYQTASGINNAQMPSALTAAQGDYKQSLRGSANTQSMMGVTNPFMGLGGGAASGVAGTGVASTLSSLSQATNLARSNRLDRLSGMGNTLNGNAELSNAGLTDLSTVASNASIRQLSRDLEMSNARKASLTALAGGAALGYMDRPTAIHNTARSTTQNMNYGPNAWANNSYQTRPFK